MKFTFPVLLLTTLLTTAQADAQIQKIKTVAGTGVAAYSGDGGISTGAQLNSPQAVAVGPTGNVYIMDYLNFRVRMINAAGYIVTIAGNGGIGNNGDGSLGTAAEVRPCGIAVDKHSNLYISDASFGVVRKVNASGIISTYAGNSIQGNAGNGGAATSANLFAPYGLAVDTADNLYIADGISNVVRKVSAAGIITRFAGDDTAGFAGDGGAAAVAKIDSPYAVAADRNGNVYITDMLNSVIRKVDAMGMISTYAGTVGMHGYTGDGGPATAATFDRPAGIAVDYAGNLYIADADNDVIRKVATDGTITTVVGNGTPGFGGDMGPVNGCNLHTPFGVAIGMDGGIYIADANNQRLRKTFASVGIDDVNSGKTIEVYPNPATDAFVVTGLDANDKVALFDITGRAVSNVHLVVGNTHEISVDVLPAGIYMLRVTDAAGVSKSVVKLVKE